MRSSVVEGFGAAMVGLVGLMGCGGAPQHVASSSAAASSAPIPMSALVTFEQLGASFDGLLAADSDLAIQAGAGPLSIVASGAAAEGDRVGGFVTLEPDTCVLAIARATARVEDLDILAFDDAGTNLVADQSVGPKPSVMVCPPHPKRVYFTARAASGSGLVALGVQDVPKERSAAVAGRLGARMSGLGDESAMREAWTGLDVRVDSHRRGLGGRWEEVRRVTLPLSQRQPTVVSTPLPANRCLDLYVMPNEEVRNLDVTVADDTGREIARAAALGDDRFALVCTPVDVTLSVAVRPHQGFGMAAVVLSRSAVGSEAELALRPEMRRVAATDSLDKVRARLTSSLAALYDRPRTVAEGTIDTGRIRSFSVALPAGCSRLDAMVGAPTAGIRAKLWSDKDAIIASASGGESVTLYGCVSTPTNATLDIEGVGRPGAMAAELRREKTAPPELVANPLGAARLLARASGGGQPFDMRTLGAVRDVSLGADKRTTLDMAVPPGTCRDVILALGPGVSGATIRVLDARTGEQIGEGSGAQEASARVCADSSALGLKVQVTVDAGTGNGLLGELVSRN